MALLIFGLIIALALQLWVLFAQRGRGLRYLSLLLMEIIPLGGAAYYGAVQPDVPYLGWQFDAVLCLWLASEVLLGYILAWGIYAVSKLR